VGCRGNPGDFGPGAATGIGVTTLKEPLKCRGIGNAAAALPQDLAIPLKTENLKGAEHIIGNSGDHPRGIQIFDAQQPAPPALSGQQITAKRRYQGAEMQGAGGRRGETADCHGKNSGCH